MTDFSISQGNCFTSFIIHIMKKWLLLNHIKIANYSDFIREQTESNIRTPTSITNVVFSNKILLYRGFINVIQISIW